MKPTMMEACSSFLTALIFALGLGISGMINPNKVLAFLDLAGHWDPSLAFVMLGAVGVSFVLSRFILKRRSPIVGGEWDVPRKKELDPPLIIGALLFGVGWGLAGFCPGPALVGLAFGKTQVFVFVAAMCFGGLVHYLEHVLLKKVSLPKRVADY